MENLKRIRAVLFDLDDTLWPILPVIQRAETCMYDWLVRHAPGVARRFDIDALRERRKALMASDPVYQLDLRALRRAGLVEAFEAAGENPALVDDAMRVFTKARNQVVLFDDVLPALARLRNEFALGSISNGVADLEEIGLAHHFQVSVAAFQLGTAKPDPAIFEAACNALQIAPGEAAYVGDDLALDVGGAQKAGLRGIWLKRADRAVPDGSGHIRPDAVCTSLDELDGALATLTVKT